MLALSRCGFNRDVTMKRLCLILGLAAAGCASQAMAQQNKINVGLTSLATDIALFVAEKRGYFKSEGLDVSLVNFQSAAVMIVPMTSGDIDVMAGAASAGLYNGLGRGLDIRLVASKVTTPTGFTSQTLIIRKDHFESGKVKTVAQLKGMKIANAAAGTAAMGSLTRMLNTGGLSLKDVDFVNLAYPQMVVALKNGAIDAALPAEPFTMEAVKGNLAVPLVRDDEVYPGHEIASIMMSGRLIRQRRDEAVKFMRAFLRGARDHNDGLDEKGIFSGPKGEAIIAILNEYTAIKDPAFFRTYPLAYCDPNGTINKETLSEDLAVFKDMDLVQGDITTDKLIDESILQRALTELGGYKKVR